MRDAVERALAELGLPFPNVSTDMGACRLFCDVNGRIIIERLPFVPKEKRTGRFARWSLWTEEINDQREIIATFHTGDVDENSHDAEQIALLIKSWLFDKDPKDITLSILNNSGMTE